MRVERIAASFFGLICCAAWTIAAQDERGPSPAVEVIAPMPADFKPSFSMAAAMARRPLQDPPDDGSNLRYRGTSIKCSPLARGDALLIQKRIAAKISQMDFQPPERIEHFRWMEDHPVKLLSWYGQIQNTNLTPNGVSTRVRVWPGVVPTEGMNSVHAVHRDYFYEDYLLGDDGSLEYVGFQDPGPHQGFGGPDL